ncbi:MAG: imidazole glycerol phosphate synthase subunit HisF [Oscillospiraceae bacterium]|nr:imidazole glycerol phosphate synthase subunit HisF [Oscillospiraceae bacterium]
MTTPIRIIPCLDVKDGRVVKGVEFANLRDAGDILACAQAYQAAGADELVLLDIAATLDGRKTFLETVKRVVSAISIPLAVGGGVGSVEDFAALINAGVSKVGINSAALKNPALINEVAAQFGSERVVVAIDAKQRGDAWGVVTHGGTRFSDIDAIAWAKEVAVRGAGEILLTSFDCDGAKTGYDLPLTKAVAEAAGIPVIASGGAGCLEHFYEAVVQGKASAVLAASLFHFGELTVGQVKDYLRGKGVAVN